jgi:hypothetical protein
MTDDEEDHDHALARSTDPDTSHDAAASVDPTILERTVFKAIKERGTRGATWDELVRITGLRPGSISPRFKPLRKKGYIDWDFDDFGNKIKRPGVSGRFQTVWFAIRD